MAVDNMPIAPTALPAARNVRRLTPDDEHDLHIGINSFLKTRIFLVLVGRVGNVSAVASFAVVSI
jgi:hypothetical protein